MGARHHFFLFLLWRPKIALKIYMSGKGQNIFLKATDYLGVWSSGLHDVL